MVEVHVDHLAQVRVHQLHHDVEVEEVLERLLRRECVEEADNLKFKNGLTIYGLREGRGG